MNANVQQQADSVSLPIVSFGDGVGFSNQRLKNLSEIYELIKIPTTDCKSDIESLRSMSRELSEEVDEVKVKSLVQRISNTKKGLPSFTVSGTFPNGSRKNKFLLQHSGRIQIDVDKLPLEQIQSAKNLLAMDPHMEAVFISPTGTGVKGVMMIPVCADDTEHKHAFAAVENYLKQQYQLQVDEQTKDVSRLFHISYDPDLVINPNAMELDVEQWQPQIAEKAISSGRLVTRSDTLAQRYAEKVLVNACAKISSAVEGKKHDTRLKQARLVGGYVEGGYLDENTALGALNEAAAGNTTASKQAAKTIEDGFADGKQAVLHPPPLENSLKNKTAKDTATYKVRVVDGVFVPEVCKEEIIWQDPVPLSQIELPSINLELLPKWLGNYIRHLAESTETPPELAFSMTLATCSTATARRFRVQIKRDYFEPTNLWLLCALPPGNRKSVVQKNASKPLYSWERDQARLLEPEIKRLQSECKTQEARIKELRSKAARANRNGGSENSYDVICDEINDLEANLPDVPKLPRLWTSDVTPEQLGNLLADHQERIAWLSSEGGVFDMLSGRYSGGIPNLDLMLKSHSGDSERVDRGSRLPIYLREPLSTMGLSPQPSVLKGLVAKPGFRGRGLLARFLYLLPPSPLGYRNLNAPEMPETVEAEYNLRVKQILNLSLPKDLDGETSPYLLQFSQDAYQEWNQFAQYMESQMRPGATMEYMADWASKCSGAVARLAGILHVAEMIGNGHWDLKISKSTVDQAAELMTVFIEHTKVAFEVMGTDESFDAARTLWNWIERKKLDQFTERDCFCDLRGRFKKMNELRQALQLLEERNYLQILEAERNGPGRKPSPLILVNPVLIKGAI